MKKGIIVLALAANLVLMSAVSALAHCIWAEVPTRVDVGQEFGITAFYADPDDPLDERDLTNLNLYVFKPNGQTVEIPLEEKAAHYEAVAKLTNAGQHLFVLERDPNRHRLTEIRDFSKAVTWAGQQGSILHDPVGIPLEINPVEVVELDNGQVEMTVQVLYNGNPVGGGEIEVFKSVDPTSFLYEEIAELDVPATGTVSLVLDPSRKYVFETDHRVPAREISGTGMAITEVRFRSTLFVGAN
ncbi:DUF4198 domain-containing protein [Desulfonatronovibrio hydrogenovorans]|uniref:DUF4198 domain-containing protein n=1 Tax=Desulfonatronovibrio hydrogenovorans TaxID=53245 RepID=UPI00048C546C|nr:DUF4198 domain-containing protein [Desulfonatronovibrio hydrogenovorans]